jgi:hypothetical protein
MKFEQAQLRATLAVVGRNQPTPRGHRAFLLPQPLHRYHSGEEHLQEEQRPYDLCG